MAKKPNRRRGLKGLFSRKRDEIEEAHEQLEEMIEGGSPTRPIEVRSPAQIESRVDGIECLRCGGHLDIEHETVQTHDQARVRRLQCRCRMCHGDRDLYFVVAPPLLN
jgi:hypothetical protein